MLAPTWLLLPADFAHNRYFAKVAYLCNQIVSVGRVRWIPDTKHVGYENVAWYRFCAGNDEPITFFPRD